MTITSITAPFVHSIMPNGPFQGFSPIHLFVPLTLSGVVGALHFARGHNIRAHSKSMLGVYIGGLLIARRLTLLPGRIIHMVFFGH
jgi:uncharacterized membrane protein